MKIYRVYEIDDQVLYGSMRHDAKLCLADEAQAEIEKIAGVLEYYIIFARRLKKDDEPWSDSENKKELEAMGLVNEHLNK